MTNEQLSETEILARISLAANARNINITFHVKVFFIRLLHIAEVNDNVYYINKSVKDIAKAVDMPIRTVSYCLSRLRACGVLYTHGSSKPQTRSINTNIIRTGQTVEK